ncbi:MAG: CoA transferase [Dehalococcoidia bacterium]|nr:MAG: CoA transferase [Dehalococcoidia bacterium]
MARQVFEGVKVADFSWVAVGPQIARELAFHGARVVRVECHRWPETTRTAGPFKDGITGINRSGFATAFNTNKYGISLDLNTPKGQDVARRLVHWADIVTDSMSPGAMAKWGLDYESCKQIKPDIIYYSTCQMGQYGPYYKFKGYGMLGVSYAGYCHLNGWPDRDPLPLFNNHSDFISPYYLITTLIAALLYRHKTGRGMYLDQSQVEVGINFLAPQVLDYIVNGRIACRMGNRDHYMSPHGLFRCKGNDRWVAIAVSNEEEWSNLCRAIRSPDWTHDSRFATGTGRKENEDELESLISEWTLRYTAEQAMNILQGAGVPAGVVQTAEDLFNDPQLKHREHFRFLEHPVIGVHAYHSPAYRLSKTPCVINKAGPCLGEDNEYVYKEVLGFSDDEIADLLIDGIITTDMDVPEVLRGK